MFLQEMLKDAAISKRVIQAQAEQQLGGFFNVICSQEDFTYTIRASQFCLVEHEGIVCYAFKTEIWNSEKD